MKHIAFAALVVACLSACTTVVPAPAVTISMQPPRVSQPVYLAPAPVYYGGPVYHHNPAYQRY